MIRKMVSIVAAGVVACAVLAQPVLAKSVRIRVASQYAMEHTTTKLLYEFKEEVERVTNGSVKIRIYPANQLGDYTQVYEELRRGTLDMGLITIPSQFDPRLEVSYLHYLAMNYKEARKIYANGSKMFELMERLNGDLGVRFLGFNVEGFGGLGLTRRPDNLKDPAAAKNILLRVPPMAVFKTTCDDEGFQTVSIPYAELYTALQTGVADGWSGGPAMVNYLQFRDVIKQFVVCNNFFETTSYLMSDRAWKKLDDSQKRAVKLAIRRLSTKSFEIGEANAEGYLKRMEEGGIEVIRLSDAELGAWADRARTVTWKKLEKRLSKEVIDELLSEYK